MICYLTCGVHFVLTDTFPLFLYPLDHRYVRRSDFRTLLRGVPARGGRRGLRTLVSAVGLTSIRRVGVYFGEPLWAICFLSVPRLCHVFRLMLWCNDEPCWPLIGVIIISWAMYAWELFMSYLVVHVLYLVVENLAAIDCLGREQVVRYALPSSKLVRKFWIRDGTAYWALQLGIRAGPTVETFTGRSRV